ncbi:hypothetical protein [Kangiella sp. TOML190]|uniref:hypothetical protein n=1 Tax=Kangiella sp. TOML190 TaxID=2931351 RepID=UPI0020411529|nr:hypothetical protein [Kangiella sp. TOML190]
MITNTSIPTDNIYKFYAIFGLAIIITCVISFLNIYNSYNEKAYERFIELKVLEAIDEINPRQAAEKQLYEIQNKVEKENKDFYMKCIGFLMGLGLFMMLYGFYYWETKVQPRLDKLIEQSSSHKKRMKIKHNRTKHNYLKN